MNEYRHGKGVFRYCNGDVYDGYWRNDLKHGIGTYHSEHGNSYEGEWVVDMMHGVGVMRFQNGDSYQGQFDCGVIHGSGIYTLCNGEILHDGEWNRGVRTKVKANPWTKDDVKRYEDENVMMSSNIMCETA
jgi:1-phosphatidylinositol-4-phosphate 5-kinase